MCCVCVCVCTCSGVVEETLLFLSFLFFHLLLNYCYWCMYQFMNPILHDARLFMKMRKYSFIYRCMFKNSLEGNIPNMKSVYLQVVRFFPSLYFSVFYIISKVIILLS